MRSITSRAFNQDVSAAKRLAQLGPVFVTDRGRPTHVLLSVDTFRQMTGPAETIVDQLAMTEPVGAELEWPMVTRWKR
ncbi:type II toxin-antitoxin system Phd/YefM family antitoxin [Sphingomonas bacterium]|uniref:type II toxin-antitoxin system Phd/YefM family antitoxin n=1 Tax=Sphingomonas bacterium TaxID=1895847 RepID=UPI001575B82B|nr:type II toxin-antitoxin system Phd/YefM family antitoxin [Sphingomonas bacterium]